MSGSYNSAVLGKNLYEEESGEKEIYVFNSRSASVGETLIALKIQECEEAGMTFEEVIQTTENYIQNRTLILCWKILRHLRKTAD